jgi:hypothetical protein
MLGRSLDLESSRPHTFTECRRCPTCGTCLLAAERDRIMAALPEPAAGWSRYRDHEHDYWASITYSWDRWLRSVVIKIFIAGRDPSNEQLVPGTIHVTRRVFVDPPSSRQPAAEQWTFHVDDIESVAAKVSELTSAERD